MQNIESLAGFRQKITEEDHVLLLLHNPEDKVSKCAFRSVTEACYLSKKTQVYVADTSQVKDLHVLGELKSVPSLLIFLKGKLVNTVDGCRDSEYIKSVMNNLEA